MSPHAMSPHAIPARMSEIFQDLRAGLGRA